MLGGNTVNANALLRFYVLHCVILPLVAVLFIAIHFWRIRKDGGLLHRATRNPMSEPKNFNRSAGFRQPPLAGARRVRHPPHFAAGQGEGRCVGDDLAGDLVPGRRRHRDPGASRWCCSSLFWDAPLEELADPMQTPNPAKAPWYFLGLQELLHYFPPVMAGVLIPTMVVLALIVIPYFNINIEAEGVWLRDRSRRLRSCHRSSLACLPLFLLLLQVWAILIPTVLIAGFMLAGGRYDRVAGRFRRWLVSKPLSFWIMTWFLIEAGADGHWDVLPRRGLGVGLAVEELMSMRRKIPSAWQFLFGDSARAFGTLSVVLVLCLAMVPVKDHFREWARYQRKYLQLIRHRSDAVTLERRFQGGIQQTWMPELGVVDRCATCHVAMKEACLCRT